jgi:nucleoside-diphosphate-sugar epimerase
VILGCGFTGEAIARLASLDGWDVLATTRSLEKASRLRNKGIPAVVAEQPEELAGVLLTDDRVAVTFPPDGHTDLEVAARLRSVKSVVYVSSTGVYGDATGRIDGKTPASLQGGRIASRLSAERSYLEIGGIVLRAPGIYGPGRGLHERIRSGQYRLPGDGSRAVSRIHVDDLARFVLAALERGRPRSVFAIGDDAPVPQREVVAWLVDLLGAPMPPSVPLDQVDETLRHDRQVDPTEAKRELGIELTYPTFREGFRMCIDSK